MKKHYLFYLRKKVGEVYHYYKWENEMLVLDARKVPIEEPYNWKDLQLTWKRGRLNQGIMKAQALPIEFILDGAFIVRELQATYNTFAEAELYIEILNDETLLHEELFRAYLNFNKFDPDFVQGSNQALVIKVPVIENELERLISAYGTTKFTVGIDSSNSSNIYIHSVKTRTIYEWVGGRSHQFNTGSSFANPMNLNFSEALKLGDHDCLLGKDIRAVFDNGLPLEQMDYQIQLFTALRPFTGRITGKIPFYHAVPSGAGLPVKLRLWMRSYKNGGDSTIVLKNTFIAEHNPATAVGGNQLGTLFIDKTYTFEKNEVVMLWLEGDGGSSHSFTLEGGYSLRVDAEFNVEASTFMARKVYDVWQNVIGQMAPGYKFTSDFLQSNVYYFDAAPSKDYITCGRQISGDAAISMRLSFSDLRNDVTARYNAAVGVQDDTVIVEHIQDFFRKNVVVFEVSDYSNFRYYPYEDVLASELQIGYEEEKNRNKFLGFDEPNGKHIYSTKLRQSNETMKMVCPFKSVMTEIENQRDNVNKPQKLDKEPDESIFLVQIEGGSQVYNIGGANITAFQVKKGGTISGVDYPDTHYGLYHSPKRILRRRDILMKSMLYNKANINQVVKFESTGKSGEAVSTFPSSQQIVEKSDVDYSGFNDMLFKPYVIEIRTESHTADKVMALRNNMYGVIRIKGKAGNIDGFILDVTYHTKDKGLATYRLLCSPNTDVDVLKREIL